MSEVSQKPNIPHEICLFHDMCNDWNTICVCMLCMFIIVLLCCIWHLMQFFKLGL